MKILIVDDVPQYLGALSRALAEEHQVVTASNVLNAQQRVDDSFDVALLDVCLREDEADNREGIALLKWIKQAHPNLPVVMMSAYRNFDASVDALNLGAAYFLRKPIDVVELKQALADAANRRPSP